MALPPEEVSAKVKDKGKVLPTATPISATRPAKPPSEAAVNALGGAAIGYAAGGNVGTAAVGANVDWNNRRLHDGEIRKIKNNAAKFAKLHPGISQRQAEERLVAQAMRQVDAAYYAKHADTDTAAEQFLRSIAGSFKADGETFLDFAPMKYYRDSGKFAEQQGYGETREQLKRNAVSSYTQRSRQIRNKTFDTATAGMGKGVANLPSSYVNGFIGLYNGTIGKPVGKEAPYVPLIMEYNNPIEEEVGAWTADKFDRAAGMLTGIKAGAVSSGRGAWNKNGKTSAGQKTGEMSVLDGEMAGGNKPRKQTNNVEYGGGNRLATRERVDKNIQEIRSARYQAELGRASRLARELQNGKLPGTLQNNRKSTAREMPASQNPNATAEKFAETFLGRKPTSIERLDGAKLLKGKCIGCWNAKMPDGTFVTYRPAGNASSSTSTTTATVEINSSALNQLNIGKKGKPTSLKFKFPAK